MNFLKGKKTYIVSLLMTALLTASQLGYIPQETFNAIMVLLNAVGLSTLRAGIKNDGIL